MAHTQTTRAELEAALFDRLGDNLFYSNTGAYPEVRVYLNEALRVWNTLARFWRERVVFQTTPTVAFYQITASTLTTNPPNLLNFTLTDQSLVAEMMYHLLETQPLQPDPIDVVTWRGTDQFDLEMILSALSRRRDQFLHETAVTLRNDLVSGVISAEGRMDIPETTLDVRRVSWRAIDTSHFHLWRMDEWEAQAQVPTWAYNPDTPPYGYALILTPPVRIQIVPPPSAGGQLDILASHSATELTGGVLLGLPDDWAWAIKWGALADLLAAEGQAKDPPRAVYCEQRYQQAVAVARLDPDILWGQINGQPITLMSLQDLDSGDPTWQDQAGRPVSVAVERDMVALSPVPDSVYSVTLDVVRPAPIPTSNSDPVQLGPEITNAILDYAHHIASFKEGGAEFFATQQQLDGMIRLAADYNAKLNALAVFRDVLEDRSVREEDRRPRREQEVV